MSDVFIIVDSRGNERYFAPLYEWADECSSFFVAYMIYPPFDTVKAFCSRGELNNGMPGFLLWEGFNIDQKIYMDIFGSLKKRFKDLVHVESAAISHDINDEDDLTAWRQEIAFGVPFYENRKILRNISRLESRYKELLEAGGNSLELWREIMNENNRLHEFVLKFRKDDK